MFKYKFVENYSYTKVKLVIESVSVQAKVTPHPLFEQVKQIHLNNDELNSKCLQLVQNGQVLIPYQKSNLFVKRCKQIMNFTPELNISEIGVNILLGNGQQDTKILDALEFNDFLSAIKICFDKIGENLHPKIIRKIKNYIKNSNRPQSQKQTIDIIIKIYKQNQKIVQDAQQTKNQIILTKQIKSKQKKTTKSQLLNQEQKIVANNKKKVVQVEQENEPDEDAIINSKKTANLLIPMQDKKMRKQQYKNSQNRDQQPNNFSRQANKQKRNYSRSNRNSGSKDKRSYSRNQEASRQKYDPKIVLGITGDTQAGWRQRNRPPRIPNNYKIQNLNKVSEKKKIQKVFNKPPIQVIKQQKNCTKLPKVAQKIVQDNLNASKLLAFSQKSIDNGSMELIFTYPKDGQNYNFAQVKDNFKLFINGNFWVSFKDGILSIKKGQSGYTRDSKIDIITNGFMAEGLTISLEGSSNLQDGGDTFGDANIQAFTGTNSQFFHVVILEVYAAVKGFINNDITNDKPKTSEIQLRNSQVSKQKQKMKQKQIQKCQKYQSRSQKQPRLLKNDLNQSEAYKKQIILKQKNEQQSQSKQPQKHKNPNNIEQNKEDSQQYQNQQDEQDKHLDKNKLLKIPKDRKNKQKAQQYQDQLQRQIKQGLKKPRGQNKSKSRSQSRTKSIIRDSQKSPRNLKQKIDPQILLGINGDSQSGWRQTNRPSHVNTGNTLTVEPHTKQQNLDEDQKQQGEQVDPTTQ